MAPVLKHKRMAELLRKSPATPKDSLPLDEVQLSSSLVPSFLNLDNAEDEAIDENLDHLLDFLMRTTLMKFPPKLAFSGKKELVHNLGRLMMERVDPVCLQNVLRSGEESN